MLDKYNDEDQEGSSNSDGTSLIKHVMEQAEAVLEGERSTGITSAETQQEVALNAGAETQVEFVVEDLAVDSDDSTVSIVQNYHV